MVTNIEEENAPMVAQPKQEIMSRGEADVLSMTPPDMLRLAIVQGASPEILEKFND